MAAVKAGVEASHLRHAGHALEDRLDRSEVVRLMERSERGEFFQLGEDLRRDHGGSAEAGAAVDHPVTHADDAAALVLRAKPSREDVDRCAAIADRGVERFVEQFLAAGILDRHPGRCADPLDLTARLDRPVRLPRRSVHAELQAGRAGIQDESIGVHGNSFTTWIDGRGRPDRRHHNWRSALARYRRDW